MTEPDDPAAMYRAAVDVALTGDIGMAPDFDHDKVAADAAGFALSDGFKGLTVPEGAGATA